MLQGNHDESIKKMLNAGFDEVHKTLDIKLSGHKVHMNHYPYLSKDLEPFRNIHPGKITSLSPNTINIDEEYFFHHNIKLNKKCPVCGSKHKTKESTFNCYEKQLREKLNQMTYEENKDFFKKYFGKILGTKDPKNSEYSVIIKILNKYKKKFIGSRPPCKDDQWLFCGHVHNLWKNQGKMINFSVEMWDYSPVSETEILNFMEKIK